MRFREFAVIVLAEAVLHEDMLLDRLGDSDDLRFLPDRAAVREAVLAATTRLGMVYRPETRARLEAEVMRRNPDYLSEAIPEEV